MNLDRLLVLQRVLREVDQLHIERGLEAVVLSLDVVQRDIGADARLVEDRAQVDVARLPMFDRVVGVEAFDAADHLVDGAETQLRHVLAQFARDEHHEVHHVLRLALEFRAQLRILRGDADRAGVEVADAHHDASRGDQRRARETEFLGAEEACDRDIAAGLELTVGLDADAPAQIVHHENLLRLGEAELPWRAGMLDRLQRRGAGAAVVSADQNHVGLGLRDARGDGADADLGDQLDADARAVVGVLQIVDELREVLDGINVVMRRRRNQSDAGHRVANLRDEVVHLVPRKLATLAGLRALRHFDLELVGIDEVVAGDAEARRGDLLNRATAPVAIRIAHEAARDPRRLRRCCSCRRCGSSRSRGFRAPPC